MRCSGRDTVKSGTKQGVNSAGLLGRERSCRAGRLGMRAGASLDRFPVSNGQKTSMVPLPPPLVNAPN